MYMDTIEALDRWASVYDSTGNVLQAIDDLELETVLSEFLQLGHVEKATRIVDLGAGAGRDTAKLQTLAEPSANVIIYGLDASRRMLEKAKERCRGTEQPTTTFIVYVHNRLASCTMKRCRYPHIDARG